MQRFLFSRGESSETLKESFSGAIRKIHIIRFRSAKTYLENERVARRENMSVSFANKRMLSLRQNKNSSFPGHAPGKDTLRAANAATEKGSTGENARANVVSRRALSPVKIKFPVATADMRRHSDTLRGAQRRRKRGLRGENRISGANSVVFPSFIAVSPPSQHFSFSLLTFSFVCGYNIDCCLMRYIGPYFRRIFELLSGGAFQCSEHISPRNVTERWSTASEREWRTPTAEKSLQDVALKAEQDSPIKAKSIRSV